MSEIYLDVPNLGKAKKKYLLETNEKNYVSYYRMTNIEAALGLA